jgi:hypothetical protein
VRAKVEEVQAGSLVSVKPGADSQGLLLAGRSALVGWAQVSWLLLQHLLAEVDAFVVVVVVLAVAGLAVVSVLADS